MKGELSGTGFKVFKVFIVASKFVA